MAVQTKADLETNIDSTITTNGTEDITGAQVNAIMKDMVDSYEDFMVSYTTVQRNALTPAQGLKIFNTDNGRVEVYSGTKWKALGTKETIQLDCSSNPNYPAAVIGDYIIVTVAGKIGGASGATVYVDDVVFCVALNAGGTQASVGTSWVINRSAGTAFNDVLEANITLSAANLLDLFDTPITAVAAPGAGKIIVPINWVVQYNHVGTAYDAGGGPIVFKFDTATFDFATVAPDIAGLAASTVSQGADPQNIWGASIANKALTIKAKIANYVTGNGTMSIKLFYKIVTL